MRRSGAGASHQELAQKNKKTDPHDGADFAAQRAKLSQLYLPFKKVCPIFDSNTIMQRRDNAGIAMPKNAILIILLAVAAAFSVGTLYMAGVISFGDGGKNGGAEDAALDLGEGFNANASHVRIAPFNLAIIQNNKVQGTLYVALDLKTGNRGLNAGVIRSRPKLRDAYLQTLSRYASNQIDPKKPVNVMLIKRLLQRATDRILGEPSATVVVGGVHITKSTR